MSSCSQPRQQAQQQHVELQQPGDPTAAGEGRQGRLPILVYAMLPLDTVDSDAVFKSGSAPWFTQALNLLAASGVHGVAVDVWWGAVERTPGEYRWNGYRQLVKLVKQAGLKMQMVMSFHACGGNTGDNAHITLPPWVLQCGREDPDLFYTDRPRGGLGQRNREYVSIWASNAKLLRGRTAYECYEDFMTAFREAFEQELGDTIEEVVVGAGPCGELRFPSYPECHGWRFPGIGEFQCYDRHALASLAQAAQAAGHPEWGYGGPHDAGHYNSAPEDTGFFSTAGNWDTPYGRFFLGWYSSSLHDHGERLLQMASRVFGSYARRVVVSRARSGSTAVEAGAQSGAARGAPATVGPSTQPGRQGVQALANGCHSSQTASAAHMVLHPPPTQQASVRLSSELQSTAPQAGLLLLRQQQRRDVIDDTLCCMSPGHTASQGLSSRPSAASDNSHAVHSPEHASTQAEHGMVASTEAGLCISPQQSLPDPFCIVYNVAQQQPHQSFAVQTELLPSTPNGPGCVDMLLVDAHVVQPSGASASSSSTCSSGDSSAFTVVTSGLGSSGVLAAVPMMPPTGSAASPGSGVPALATSMAGSNPGAMLVAPPSPSPASSERAHISMCGGPSMTLVSSSTSTLSNCGSGGGAPDTARSMVQDLGPALLPVPQVAGESSCYSIPALAMVASPVQHGRSSLQALPAVLRVSSDSLYLTDLPGGPSATASPGCYTATVMVSSAPAPLSKRGSGAQLPSVQLRSEVLELPTDALQPSTPTTCNTNTTALVSAICGKANQVSVVRGLVSNAAAATVAVASGAMLTSVPEGALDAAAAAVQPQMRELGKSMGHLSISTGSMTSTQALSELNSSEEVQQRSSMDASCSAESAMLPSIGALGSSSPATRGRHHALHADVCSTSTIAVSENSGRGQHGITLSLKIPGVHWWYRSRSHAAELTAGYYNTATRDGYEGVVEMCARYGVALTLTCVEMCDGQHPITAACSPEGLLKQVRMLTARHGVLLSGENALPIFLPQGGVDTVALDRIVINTRTWYGAGALHSVASEHAALLAAQQNQQWLRHQQLLEQRHRQQPHGVPPLALHTSLPFTRGMTPSPPPSLPGYSLGPTAAPLYGLYNGQWQGGSYSMMGTGSRASNGYDMHGAAAANLTTGPLYSQQDSGSSASSYISQPPGTPQPTGVPYNMYSLGKPDSSSNQFGRSFSDTGRYLQYYQTCLHLTSSMTAAGLCAPSMGMYASHPPSSACSSGAGGSATYRQQQVSASLGLHRDASACSTDCAIHLQHQVAGPGSAGNWPAASTGSSCSLTSGFMPPPPQRAISAGGGGVDVPLGMPGEHYGVRACGLRTDSYADIREPLPSMRSFTFLRLGPEIMLPGVLAPWLRFIAGMQQGGYS